MLGVNWAGPEKILYLARHWRPVFLRVGSHC